MKTKAQITENIITMTEGRAKEYLRDNYDNDEVLNPWMVGYLSAMFGDIAMELQKANPEAFEEYCKKWGL